MSSGPEDRRRDRTSGEASPKSDADGAPHRVRRLSDNAAGHLDFEGNRSVWRWNTPGGDYSPVSTTMLIRRLDNPALSIDDPTASPAAAPREKRSAPTAGEPAGFFELSLQTTGRPQLEAEDKGYQPYGDYDPPPPATGRQRKRR